MAYHAGLMPAEQVQGILTIVLVNPYVGIKGKFCLGNQKKANQPAKSASPNISAGFAVNPLQALLWEQLLVIDAQGK